MSRSKCPFPDEFELIYNCRRYTGINGTYQIEQRPAIARKVNGWYTVYENGYDASNHYWCRRVYGSALRWYDLQRKIEQGIFSLEQPEDEVQIDISELM